MQSPSRDFLRIVSALMEDIATPRSLTVELLVRHGEWAQLANLRCAPDQYQDADSYYRAAIATEFLRKCDGLPTGIDTAAAAKASFWEAEAQCARTNAYLSRFLEGGPLSSSDLRVAGVLEMVRDRASGWLGRCPSGLNLKLGPGSTLEDRGSLILVPDKFTSRPTVTSSATWVSTYWVKTWWYRALVATSPQRSDPKVCRGNRFTTVPKTSLTDRGIAIEPSMNVAYQLAVGGEIRSRLARVGCDLRHSQDLHRRLAREGSLSGAISTIDLSSASDTVCRKLVRLIIGGEWLTLLESLRSPTTHIDGKTVFLEKFSSMGNGFTFELESLIFLAISHVAMELCGVQPKIGTNLSVYGDDIIVPSSCYETVIGLLRLLGFTPNPKKSFNGGYFRESCGGDYFGGWAVRPYYLKELPCEPHHYIGLANGLRGLVSCDTVPSFGFGNVQRAWLRVLDCIPSDIRRNCRGPAALGDVVIHDDHHRWGRIRVRSSIRYFQVYRPVFRKVDWRHWKQLIQLAARLYGVGKSGLPARDPSDPYRGPVDVGLVGRASVSGYKKGWQSFS